MKQQTNELPDTVCVICKFGTTKPSTGTITLERGSTTIVFRKVPAEVCVNCGEEYFDEDTTTRLLSIADEAASAGVQVDVREYVAA